MPIPDLNENGLLPEGVYDCTLDEIGARFGRFQTTDRRIRLFEKLRALVEEERQAGLAIEIIVDGSFVTDKPEPGDIEDRVMRDRINNEKPLLGQTIEGIGMMYRSLKSLYEDEYPRSPAWFAVMAQGSIHQIRDLLDDLEWLMEDMNPQELQGQAAQFEEPEGTEAAVTQEAA